MKSACNEKVSGRKPRGPTQYRGITAAAKQLQVRREHLWLVLTGKRTSTRLMLRYQALKQAKIGSAQNGVEHEEHNR